MHGRGLITALTQVAKTVIWLAQGLKANYCASAVPRHEANDASNAPSLRRIAPLVYFFNVLS